MLQINTHSSEKLFFSFSGDLPELKSELLKWLTTQGLLPSDADENNIDKILLELRKLEPLSEDGECFKKERSNMRSMVSSGGNYHISVKATTIVLASLLAGIVLPEALVALVLGLKQIDAMGRAITPLDEYEGEKCVTHEIWQRRKSIRFGVNKSFFESNKGICINNHMSDCRFKDNDNCAMSPTQLVAILDKLNEKYVLDKRRGEYFYMF